MIGYARFDRARYYAWAPHDAQNEYVIIAERDGQGLPRREVGQRFGFHQRSVNPRAIEHVIRAIDHHQRVRGNDEGIAVTLMFRTNGRRTQVQRWTPDKQP